MDTIFEKSYTINSTNINSTKHLGLLGILGFLQDTASEHAEKLGFGFDEMIEKGILWVLIRQNVKMYRWPIWQDTIIIKTWSKPASGLYAFREFEIFIDNEKIGECATTWMILDYQARRPIKVEKINKLFNHRNDYALNFSAKKVNVDCDFPDQKSFEVRNTDIDMNNHVNNIRYAQWILDSIPFEYHKSHVVREFEVNFIAETFLGDTIVCHSKIDRENKKLIFKGIRESDGKLVYAAKLNAGTILNKD